MGKTGGGLYFAAKDELERGKTTPQGSWRGTERQLMKTSWGKIQQIEKGELTNHQKKWGGKYDLTFG